MWNEPKALKEIHKIQEEMYEESKNLSDKDLIAKIRRNARTIKKKYGLRLKQKISIGN